jgi:diamine N-acetyltransferase
MMNFTIREASAADAIVIADISRQTFYETFAVDNTAEDMRIFLEEQFTRDSLIEEVGREAHHFFLAYDGNEIAGYVKLREDNTHPSLPENSIEIARIYVLKPWIRKGVGNMLMQTCINYAKNKNSEVVWLGVWEKNGRAIEFYQKWGFEKFGETDFYLGNDIQRDWIMKKLL